MAISRHGRKEKEVVLHKELKGTLTCFSRKLISEAVITPNELLDKIASSVLLPRILVGGLMG